MKNIFEVPIPDNDLLDKAEQLRLASIKTSQTNKQAMQTNISKQLSLRSHWR